MKGVWGKTRCPIESQRPVSFENAAGRRRKVKRRIKKSRDK
jgi:hypothetical protein